MAGNHHQELFATMTMHFVDGAFVLIPSTVLSAPKQHQQDGSIHIHTRASIAYAVGHWRSALSTSAFSPPLWLPKALARPWRGRSSNPRPHRLHLHQCCGRCRRACSSSCHPRAQAASGGRAPPPPRAVAAAAAAAAIDLAAAGLCLFVAIDSPTLQVEGC